MDILYYQVCSDHDSYASRRQRWLPVLFLSILLHVFIIIAIKFDTSLIGANEVSRTVPIIVVLEEINEEIQQPAGEQARSVSVPPVIEKEQIKPEGLRLEKREYTSQSDDIPELPTISGEELDQSANHKTAAELVQLSKDYVAREADSALRVAEKNKELWLRSPSLMFVNAGVQSQPAEEPVDPEVKIMRIAITEAMTFPDCWTAYTGADLLAIPILIGDAFRKYGCRW